MSDKIPTHIVDKNGRHTTVHKNSEVAAQTRIKKVPAPVYSAPVSDGYKAPNVPAMHKLVEYDDEIMTWGQVLEEINPIGVRRSLIDGERSAMWSAVHPDNPNISTMIPAAVAKASGLKDVTTPMTAAEDDWSLALMKFEKLQEEQWSAHHSEESTAKLEKQREVLSAATEVRDNLKLAQKREIISELTADQQEGLVYSTQTTGRYAVDAYMADAFLGKSIDEGDTELTKKIASAPMRKLFSEGMKNKLFEHPDENVRAAYMESNMSLINPEIFNVIENDPSEYVRGVAQSLLEQRGYKMTRTSPHSVSTTRL